MNSFDDKRCCPHCLQPLNEQSYLMSRDAAEDVLSLTQIWWIVGAVLAVVLLVLLV
jgi:hypothetical protein